MMTSQQTVNKNKLTTGGFYNGTKAKIFKRNKSNINSCVDLKKLPLNSRVGYSTKNKVEIEVEICKGGRLSSFHLYLQIRNF